MNFSSIDFIIIILYLVGIAVFGIFSGGKQKSVKDYFLSESAVPWWAVCFAVVATETSALTFLSIPGIAYATNFNFLQLAFGYLIGRIIISFLLLPRYFQGELSTAYAFLGERFGSRMRKASSIVFMGTRTFADGVRLYTTAIPLALLMKGFNIFPGISDDMFYIISIVILSALTLIYVFLGGVRAVIWTDVAQLFIYILGAVFSCFFLWRLLHGSVAELFSDSVGLGKFQIFNPGFNLGFREFLTKPYTLLASILGGMFLSMASHGTDQLIIQRILATNNLRKAQRAMMLSGIIIIFQFFVFLFVGTLLYLFYFGAAYSPNEVFAKFILEELPSGLSGLIIAGILAAAMSTLSGSISALSSATMLDIIIPSSRQKWDESMTLLWSRRISLAWCIILVFVASLFIQTPKTVVELALSIASFTYGGLLGVFLLGTLFRHVKELPALIGFGAGIIAMSLIITLTPIAWTWYTLIGSGITIITGLVANSVYQPVGIAVVKDG